MRWCFLDSIEYEEALVLQQRLRRSLLEGHGEETLLLLQHPAVITLGRSGNPANVVVADAERRSRGVKLVRVTRGGDVTYHGPGQLVGYPIRRVGRRVKDHVRGMIDVIMDLLTAMNIESWWDRSRPGVWCAGGKIAAVGVDAVGGVAIHGFALNVAPNLSHYEMIVPCGIQAPVTSVAEMLPHVKLPSLATIAGQVAELLAQRFQVTLRKVLREDLP